MKAGGQALVIFFAALALAGLTAAVHPKKPSFRDRASAPGEISLQEVQNWKESVLWVDARRESDYEAEHIPGAVSLNPDNWPEQLPHFLDGWTPAETAEVYFTSGGCDTGPEMAD